MEPLYHLGDIVYFNFTIYNRRITGTIVPYPNGNCLIYDERNLRIEPDEINFNYLYTNEYQNPAYISNGEIFVYDADEGFPESDESNKYYLVKLFTGQLVWCIEGDLILFEKEKIRTPLRRYLGKKRNGRIAALALNTRLPLDIYGTIASFTSHPLSRNVGGRKKTRKTRKTRRTKTRYI